MTHVLDPVIPLFVIVYLDDIYIYSKSAEEHLDHIRKVLTTLRENKLCIKIVKCFWAKQETEYLAWFHRWKWQCSNIPIKGCNSKGLAFTGNEKTGEAFSCFLFVLS